MEIMMEIAITFVYAVLALILMFVGYKLFDWFTPFDFAAEIKEKNIAVGIVIGGMFVAIAMIVRAAII